ncbi:hypothetical protein HYPDE_38433 [Hyphomicrobium denitrificans 1NES1]|uniref:Uncharacterized protein n=1 Tax=Hyphomicrobium denitrificans 1NES1 TaxID=670307 RepID=N0BFV9_9HYPH|nr:hypothetical protein HYPDE_38433 [Hyphomicrobium denitrificans 1NES1]
MTERYSYFLRLRGRPKRIKKRVSREVYVFSRKQKSGTPNKQPVWDPIPAVAAVGPAADF